MADSLKHSDVIGFHVMSDITLRTQILVENSEIK